MRIVQKYVVRLSDSWGPDGHQVWLGYGIGQRHTTLFRNAFQYDTERAALLALRSVRRTGKRWPGAKVMATLVEIEEVSE